MIVIPVNLSILFAAATSVVNAKDNLTREKSVLDLFPASGLPSTAETTTCSFTYEPSGSRWHPEVNEKDVFLASIRGSGWQLGVGKGGHIYSLRGPYGESVPPQRISSPWNDEVWQAVATHEDIITPIHKYQAENRDQYAATEPLMYFIHQAGIYTPGAATGDASKPAAFYSPVLRKRWDPETRTLSLVNWMQQAHTPCVWKSGVLIYTAFRDLGEGAIEINQVLHNFGPEALNYFSTPWGGIRKSSMPHTIISKADGSWAEEDGLWDWSNVPERNLVDSAGWEAWVRDPEDDTSPTLGFVVGKGLDDTGNPLDGKRILLWGDAGRDDVRDYQVTEQSSQLLVEPGGSLSIRWYLISGDFGEVRKTAAKLAEHARVTRISFAYTAIQTVRLAEGQLTTESVGERWGGFLAFPMKGSTPVFLLKDKRTGQQTVSADIYALAEAEPFPNPLPEDHKEYHRYQNRVIYKQYSPHIGYEDLLGYAWTEKPEGIPARKIRTPENVRLHASAQDLWLME